MAPQSSTSSNHSAAQEIAIQLDSHLSSHVPTSLLKSRTPSRPLSWKNASSQTPKVHFADPENMRVIVRLRPAASDRDRSPLANPGQPVRLRPTNPSDGPAHCPYTLQPEEASIQAGGTWFTFDGVHPSHSTTREIYEQHFSSMVRDAVEGYNSTLFAYGATGSGKSHSMLGTPREPGVVPQAINEVFALIDQDQDREYVVRVSYLEIYNEQLRDLLADEPMTTVPKIHEDRQGRIFVRPLVATPCADQEDAMDLILIGESRRKIEATEWNARSSRAHAILTLTIESRPVILPPGFPITSDSIREVTQARQLLSPVLGSDHGLQNHQESPSEAFLGTGVNKLPMTPSVAKFKQASNNKSTTKLSDGIGSIRISHLNLVDLAGSERLTDNEARNKEAAYIKKSLLSLQNVVSSLTELSTSTSSSTSSNAINSNNNTQKHRLMHIPYRNSQLTRLLQTSLSGNAKVSFLCTISPDPDCEPETLSTLRFAAGAKKVVTKAELGQVMDRATLLQALESKVLELEAALLTNADYTEALERERDEAVERADGASKTCDEYEAKLSELQTLRTPLKEQHDHLRRLILTGSPRSSYAVIPCGAAVDSASGLVTISPGGSGGTHRRKSMAKRRPSRLSEVMVQQQSAGGMTKVGWEELLFGGSAAAAAHTTKMTPKEVEEEKRQIVVNQGVDELNLTIAKLEATLAESEETHAGEVMELRNEIESLNEKIVELEKRIEEDFASQANKVEELERSHEKEVEILKAQITKLETEQEAMGSSGIEAQEPRYRLQKFRAVVAEPRCSDVTLDGEEIHEEETQEEEVVVQQQNEYSDKDKLLSVKKRTPSIKKKGKTEMGSAGPVRRSARGKKN